MAPLLIAAVFVSSGASAADSPNGKAVYDKNCMACHSTGAAGAPKLGDVAAWSARVATGLPALLVSAAKGKGVMPPRGGNAALTDAELKAVVSYMVAQATSSAKPGASAAVAAKSAEPPAKSSPAAAAPVPAAVASAVASPTPAAVVAPAVAAPGANVNSFNRLMRPPPKRNLPPMEDGIHDPTNAGTAALQPPMAAFGQLPKSNDGNRVDWVKSLNENLIKPRYDRADPTVAPMVMDMNIVREVKGSMPDVVYPHKQHTQWLDCSNCHPAIFIPQKGANQISMASILLGQKCGVCHGKVAFPISECRRCHSKSKPMPAKLESKP